MDLTNRIALISVHGDPAVEIGKEEARERSKRKDETSGHEK